MHVKTHDVLNMRRTFRSRVLVKLFELADPTSALYPGSEFVSARANITKHYYQAPQTYSL